MIDHTSDLLIRIKNASAVKRSELSMPYSKMKEAILKILETNGFVKDIRITEDKAKKNLSFSLIANKNITHIRQLSTSGHRIYTKGKDIKIPLRGLALVIISTSSGVINAKEAQKKGLGGELICEIW